MSNRDWFRKTTWTKVDGDDFESRLRRARRDNRAEYLRIQAGHLAESRLYSEAIELLDRMICEYPERTQLAPAQSQRGQCFDAMDEPQRAADAFLAALDEERTFPNVQTRASFEFPVLVAERGLTAYFARALEVLDRDSAIPVFPIDRYQIAAARALISAQSGDLDTARDLARIALDVADVKHSGLRYHRALGLVPSDDSLRESLEKLAKTHRCNGSTAKRPITKRQRPQTHMSKPKADRSAVRSAIVSLLDDASAAIPNRLVGRLPESEELDGEPAWHDFESPIWALGEEIRQLFLRKPALRTACDLQIQILGIATDRRAHRGRQSFVMLLGYKSCANHAARLFQEIDDPCIDGHIISTLYKMKAHGFASQIQPFVTNRMTWIRKEAIRYIAWDTDV